MTLAQHRMFEASVAIAERLGYPPWCLTTWLIDVLAYLSLRPEHEQDEVLAELQALRDGVRT